jgi:hypothetical protein
MGRDWTSQRVPGQLFEVNSGLLIMPSYEQPISQSLFDLLLGDVPRRSRAPPGNRPLGDLLSGLGVTVGVQLQRCVQQRRERVIDSVKR